MKEKIFYLCMNAIFSKTMLLKRKLQIVETANSNMVLSIKYLGHVLLTIEMLVFILQLLKFLKNFVNSNFQ